MIKCFGFGKLLKQLFIISLISCFILLGSSSVNACTPRTAVGEGVYINGGIHPVGGLFTSSSNNAFDNGVFTLGNFNSSNLGLEKKLFAYDDYDFWFWDSDGLPYFYGTDANVEYFYQGNPNGYYYCEEIDGNTPTTLTNCSYNSIGSGSAGLFKTFMSSVKFGDYYAYLLERYYRENNYMSLCISNSFLGHTLCFTNDVSMGCSGINSKGYSNLTYNSIPDSILFDSPAYSGLQSNIGGSQSGNINNNITGDYIYSNCTYKQIIDYANSMGMSRNLCFGGLDNFSLYNPETTYNPIPGTGKSLSQILVNANSTWSTPLEWFDFWNGLYGGYVDMWSSYPAVYKTRFDFYYQYNGNQFDFNTINEYCTMINLDIDFDNTLYKGRYFKKTCDFIKDNDLIDSSGNIVVGVNWNGVGNIGSGNNNGSPRSVVVYIQDFFNNLKEKLPARSDVGLGFLPTYIITFMLALMLFRFISH